MTMIWPKRYSTPGRPFGPSSPLMSLHASDTQSARHGLVHWASASKLTRDSPDEPQTGVNSCSCCRVLTRPPGGAHDCRNPGTPNGGRGADLAIFVGIW